MHKDVAFRAEKMAHEESSQILIETIQCFGHLRILVIGDAMLIDEGAVADQVFSDHASATQTLLAKLETRYTQCDAIIISDYCYGMISEEVIACLQCLQTQYPKPLLVDSKALWRFRMLPVAVITPNALEAQHLLDRVQPQESYHLFSSRDTAQVSALAQQLLQTFSTQYVVLTLGPDGAFLVDADRPQQGLHISAHPIAQANDVWAGDSFAAALIVMLAAGAPIEDAVRVGSDAASIAVTKTYTATVSQQELLQRVSLRISTEHLHDRPGRRWTTHHLTIYVFFQHQSCY